jgi:hypothetical protein
MDVRTRATRRVSPVKHELFILPEHLGLTKAVFRSSKWKDRQYNGQKKKDKKEKNSDLPNTTQKCENGSTQKPNKNGMK